jgi:hypothetical protein
VVKISIEVELSYSSDKKHLLMGSEGMPGVKDYDFAQNEEVDVYGLGREDRVEELVVETNELKVRQVDSSDTEWDKMVFELENGYLEDEDDIQNYISETDKEHNSEIVKHFWESAHPAMEFGV